MRLYRSPIHLLMFALCALYAGGEWWAENYREDVLAARRAHNFDRALFITGVPAPKQELRTERHTVRAESSSGPKGPPQLVSAETLAWLQSRHYVESLHAVSTQYWAAKAGGRSLPGLWLYGMDEATVAAFRLGDPGLLAEGRLVLSEPAAKELGQEALAESRMFLEYSDVILGQVPAEFAEKLRASRPVLKLASGNFAEPPGLRRDRPVAYIHRDADRLNGMVSPGILHIVLLRNEVAPEDAQAEIHAYLAQYEKPNDLGVMAAVWTIDQYFPPLIPLADLDDWMLRLRIGLVVGLLTAGLGVAWLRLRQQAFELALRRALGATPGSAFRAVYGPWLGSLLAAAAAGAGLVWLASAASGFWRYLPASLAVFAAAGLALALGTLAVAQGALRREPLRELAHGN